MRYIFSISLVCLFCFLGSLDAQVERMLESSRQSEIQEEVTFKWRVTIAKDAMQYGLYELSGEIFEDLLNLNYVRKRDALGSKIRLDYVQSLIESQKLKQASKELGAISGEYARDRVLLYKWVISYLRGFDGSKKQLTKALSNTLKVIQTSNLNQRDTAWYFFLEGVLNQFELSDKELISNKIYDLPYGQAFFESLNLRLNFNQDKLNSKVLSDLKDKYKDNFNSKIAYYFAYDYAYLLALKGEDARGIKVINDELNKGEVVYSSLELDTLRLLKVMILGANSKSGRDLLLTLMQLSENPIILNRSFRLFIDFYDPIYVTQYLSFIEEFIETQKDSPLRAQFYLLKTQISLQRVESRLGDSSELVRDGALKDLKEDAEYIIENFPGLDALPRVYELLAYVALKQSSPQYRLAADYLTQVLEFMQGDFVRLNGLIGDCYFLNKDYQVAAQYFWNVLSQSKNLNLEPSVLADFWLRYVTAKSRSGEIEDVDRLLEEAALLGTIPTDAYWSIQWNVILGLKDKGKLSSAISRLNRVFLLSDAESVSPELRIRFQWMYLYIKYLAGISDRQSVEDADTLLKRLALTELQGEVFSEEALTVFSSQVMLLKGQFLLGFGEENEGIAVLDDLQDTYPDTLSSELSYIIIADYYSQEGAFDLVESNLLELAKKYPQSKYAPEALLEAALNAEKREPNSYLQAVRFLNQLVTNYPESSLVYFALRHQGDLLRKASDFSSALKVYENLIQKYPNHPNRYLVELSRIDALLALSGDDEDVSGYNEILAQLERLMDLPNLSISFHMEVGYKLAYVFMKQGLLERSVEIATAFIDQYPLLEDESNELALIGRYWFARTLFLLSDNLVKLEKIEDAKKMYRLILEHKLPGNQLAKRYLSELL